MFFNYSYDFVEINATSVAVKGLVPALLDQIINDVNTSVDFIIMHLCKEARLRSYLTHQSDVKSTN